jgi:hypothetical protein
MEDRGLLCLALLYLAFTVILGSVIPSAQYQVSRAKRLNCGTLVARLLFLANTVWIADVLH